MTTALEPMKSTLEQVKEFHDAFGVNEPHSVEFIDVNRLRLRLLIEELDELSIGLWSSDKVQVLDALTDLQYVLDGAYHCFGLAHLKDAAFAEVHRSNMSKLGANGKPIRRDDGKILKGPNYTPPNLQQFFK